MIKPLLKFIKELPAIVKGTALVATIGAATLLIPNSTTKETGKIGMGKKKDLKEYRAIGELKNWKKNGAVGRYYSHHRTTTRQKPALDLRLQSLRN